MDSIQKNKAVLLGCDIANILSRALKDRGFNPNTELDITIRKDKKHIFVNIKTEGKQNEVEATLLDNRIVYYEQRQTIPSTAEQ